MTRTMLFVAGLAVTAMTATGVLAQTAPRDLPPGEGPRATSAATTDDAVGYAKVLAFDSGTGPTVGIAAEYTGLPKGSFIEVTALDSGRTIAMVTTGPFTGHGVAGLSPQAAEALGVVDHAAVRVRAVTPDGWEQATLRAGRATGARLDAPPALLTALRKRLPPQFVPGADHAKGDKRVAPPHNPQRPNPPRPQPAQPEAAPEAVSAPAKSVLGKTVSAKQVAATSTPKPRAAPPPATRGGYQVQVAALSAADRATALARNLGGHVAPAGKMFRVMLGPFPDARAAQQARDTAARKGYRGAQISRSDP